MKIMKGYCGRKVLLFYLFTLLPFMQGCRSLPEGSDAAAELPEHPQLLWEHRHNVRTVAAPEAWRGLILYCDKHGQLEGLDQDSGEPQLTLSLGGDMEATFAIADSTLYVGMIDGRVRSLSLTNGRQHWAYQTEGQILAAPVLTDINGKQRLFVGSYDHSLYTLDPVSGRCVGSVSTGYYVNAAVALWQQYVLFGGCDAWVRMVDAITGQATDSLKLDAYIPASPVIDGNTAYVADYQGNVYELTLADGRIASHRKLLKASDDGEGGMLSVPVVASDAVYLLLPDRRLVCLQRKDGHERWHAQLKGDVGECSPVLVGQRLLVCTKTGVVTIHDATTGQQLWEYEVGEQIIARPVVGDERFYVLTARGTLLGFGEK